MTFRLLFEDEEAGKVDVSPITFLVFKLFIEDVEERSCLLVVGIIVKASVTNESLEKDDESWNDIEQKSIKKMDRSRKMMR